VGHTRTLNVDLAVRGVVQHVKVSDLDPQLDQTSATLGAPIKAEQVKQLPLNGRNWSTLTALVPGAVDTGEATNAASASGAAESGTATPRATSRAGRVFGRLILASRTPSTHRKHATGVSQL
jgi:hypothetical protein